MILVHVEVERNTKTVVEKINKIVKRVSTSILLTLFKNIFDEGGLNKLNDTIIYLIRHAETVDENGIRNTNEDSQMINEKEISSVEGEEQAKKLVLFIKLVYSE